MINFVLDNENKFGFAQEKLMLYCKFFEEYANEIFLN